MRTGAPVRDDRGSQPGHPRLGELLSEGECPNPVPPSRRLDRATPALLHRPAMAEYGVAALSHVPSGERVRTGSADPSGAWDQDHPPSTATTTQESGLRENRTSRLSERTEEGRKPDLLRLYTGERVLAHDVHGTGAADALAAGAPEHQRRVDRVLDPDQGVEDHRPAVAAVDVVGVDARVLPVIRVPAIDAERGRPRRPGRLRPGLAVGVGRVLGDGELGHSSETSRLSSPGLIRRSTS